MPSAHSSSLTGSRRHGGCRPVRRVGWLAASLLAGCVVNAAPPEPRLAPPVPAVDRSGPFAYPPDPEGLAAIWQRTEEGERELRVTFPARPDLPGDRREVRGHLLLPASGRAPAVLVLPILGGGYRLARGLASYLARRGLAAFWLERRGRLLDPSRPLAVARDAFRAAVIDARRALDWLERCPLVRGDRLGLFGVSRGGIVGALVAGADPRVRASVLALAGGDIPLLLEESEESEVIRFRDAQVAALANSDERFREACRQLLADVDPLAHAGLVDPHSVLMIRAFFDAVVPAASSDALWRALGRPRLVEYPTGHYGLALFLWHARSLAADHLTARLAGRVDAPAGRRPSADASKPASRCP